MTSNFLKASAGLAAVFCLAACSGGGTASSGSGETSSEDGGEVVRINLDPYPSTYEPMASGTTLIQNATIFDGLGGQIDDGDVLIENGLISAVGVDLEVPEGATVIDAVGRYVTPGVIDIHSHLGVYPSPGVGAHSDGNEATQPVTAEVWAEHSVWPQDPGFEAALAGGVTTLHVLPGSANLFGGRGVTLRNVSGRTVQEMKFPDAPYTLKMACGENPSRVYGNRGTSPATDMGNMAGYRAAWQRASDYRDDWHEYWDAAEAGEDASPPRRDLELDTMMGVLEGEVLVQMHCYRADQMAQIMDLAREFDYQVTTFHHAVEAYKIPDLLAENGACVAVWADWGGFKMEAYDSIRENLALSHANGACAMIHSDDSGGIQRLNQEIAKALADGRRAGIEISEAEAWTWVANNPATALGIADQTGSLQPGLRGDVVLWSGNPYSVYTRADQVWIDGAMAFNRADESTQPVRDFMLGQPGEGDQ
ncbi:MAG: amidohydrolase family protein [Maricaulis sp.]|uniref:amidohydrolase n=1 Tax=Maricaulis sp. TaxID=1486257 RepID=UPI001B020668|nr:amidohydrolase [Maricaulis sp.]MBO6730434.1 amidohydrolase family protein [Maricaulis sp.]MBO6848632.1 amidohydrolase family protein [Maricaulis sp.]MBO6878122.1 amidohydrolase family protein [Maricaulis sp.]